MARMLAEAVQRTRCSHFGLLVGQVWQLPDMGLVGEVMRRCDTVGEALRTGTVLHRVNSDGGTGFLFEHGRTVSLGYAVFHPQADRVSPLYDGMLALLVNVMRELCGPAWNPTEVLLPRAALADDRPYRELFRCRLRFDAEYAALTFPAAVLDRPLRDADATGKAALEREIARRMGSNLVPQLYRSLRLLLLEGGADGNRLAQQFEMHRRTLNRRLRAQGRTFQSVLDDVRFEAARHLLAETTLPVVQVAGALGYAEVSAFTRAFRRWAGRPPVEWREAHGHTAAGAVHN
jgi:AraC-like DNA-binding protein